MSVLGRAHSFINDCMKEMYVVPEAMLKEQVNKFIHMNNELIGKVFPGFRYRGEQYGTYEKGVRSPQLHRSLEESFLVVLLEYENSKSELVTIKHFLINTVNRTTSVDDLYELLPTGLHQFVEGYSANTIGTIKRLDREVMDQLKEMNQPVVTKIREVLALNMLVV